MLPLEHTGQQSVRSRSTERSWQIFLLVAHQLLAEFLEAAKLDDSRWALRKRRARKRLGHCLTGHSPSKPEVGDHAGSLRFWRNGKMAPTAPDNGGDRTSSPIAQSRKLLQDVGAFDLRSSEIVQTNSLDRVCT